MSKRFANRSILFYDEALMAGEARTATVTAKTTEDISNILDYLAFHGESSRSTLIHEALVKAYGDKDLALKARQFIEQNKRLIDQSR